MLTDKDYCDYETCVALREVGCRIETEWYIHQPSYERDSCYLCFGIPRETSVLDECDYIPRLSLYEAQKWLMEEKDIDVLIKLGCKDVYSSLKHYSVYLSYIGSFIRRFQYLSDEFNSYEEALSEGIKVAIKILKEK